jgi:bifunctional DNA-binding transcriptional regulator/antitoxin component of YhaV-PrlF toxin-antitoxin module
MEVLGSKIEPPHTRNRKPQRNILITEGGFRRITSKGQVTIPEVIRKRYNITTQTKLQFLPSSEGILLRPTEEQGTFKQLAGSASKNWTVDEMLKRLNELRKENA